MSAPILLEQTLHGYDRGHRLLAGSVDLGFEDDRAMLTMSDLSGSRVAEGFLEYLTGYMLPSGSHFVIARTWYASEMKRPGCVWTHSLLIPGGRIGDVKNASALQQLFVRPQLNMEFRYSEKLMLPFGAFDVKESRVSAIDVSSKQCLLEELYSSDDGPVGFGVLTGVEMEGFLLNLWSQLWPRLRTRISFCSGSLSIRALNGRALDIQCGPDRVVREIRSSLGKSCAQEQWAGMILDDLQRPNGFRDFLVKNGEDLQVRSSVALLAKDFLDLQRDEAVTALERTVNVLPAVGDGVALKSTLLKAATAGSKGQDDALTSLIARWYTSLPYDDVSSTLESLARHSPRTLLAFLDRSVVPSNDFESDALKALAFALTRSDYEWMDEEHPKLWQKLVRVFPAVVFRPGFWNWDIALSQKEILFRSLVEDSTLDKRMLLDGLFQGESPKLISRVIRELSDAELPQALDWLQRHENLARSFEWIAFLKSHVSAFTSWLNSSGELTPIALFLAANTVGPIPPPQMVLGSGTMSKLCNLGKSGFEGRHEIAAFLYVIASSEDDPSRADVFVDAFTVLHKAIARATLSNRAWELIAPMLVPVIGAEWDSCEQLRRATLHFLSKNHWPKEQLAKQLVGDNDLFYDFLRTAGMFEPGMEFMEWLHDQADRGTVGLPKKPAKELRKLVKRSWF